MMIYQMLLRKQNCHLVKRRAHLLPLKLYDALRRQAPFTYNPLALSYVIGNQDKDVTGAVTAENSLRDSFVTLSKEEDAIEEVHSPM
ncbi:SPX domain [Salvia divinorum]|uniref:SPX domain n=1 Tax=Salvia divinorum TaxID=28513 RepID=A0ABD1I330_SALDI